jgi:NAD-dependent DNA ligase
VARAIVEWFAEHENKELIQRLKKVLTISNQVYQQNTQALPLSGHTYVVTGTLITSSCRLHLPKNSAAHCNNLPLTMTL